ncbi:MAG: InlB B-repeat-containing protein [Clostridia bacterium]|nr:InlB B-repeat-containing protein [Clostridia bacterium]
MKKLLGIFAVVFASLALMACSPKTATIRLNVNGGDALSQTEYVVNLGEPATLPTPTKTGYTFDGWNFEDSGEPADLTEWALEGEFNLIAQWSAKTCIIRLDANGGTVSNSNYYVKYDEKPNQIPTPTRDGYEFLGWYDGNTKVTGSSNWTKLEETTLVAKWEGEMVTLVLDADGGTVDYTMAQTIMGEEVPALPTPTKTGYEFVEWQYNGASLEETWNVWSQTPITIKAVYTANEYTLSLNVGEGEHADAVDGVITYTVTYGEEYALPEPTIEGYNEFSYWTYNGTPIATSDDVWSYTDDIELTAVYRSTHYLLTFVQEGEQDVVVPVEVDTAIETIPAIEAVYGYDVNWTIDGTTVADENAIKALRASTTITVLRTARTFTVNFDAGEGATGSTTLNGVVFGAEITLPVAEKVGHTLLGWALEGSNVPVSSTWAIDEADGVIDLVAIFSANTYTVKYIVDEFTAIESPTLTVTYGEEYALDMNLTCEHATFNGWTYNGEPFASTGTWTLTQDIELVAVMIGKTFNVTFLIDGQEVQGTLQYGANITNTFVQLNNGNEPSKLACIFDGWVVDGEFFDKTNGNSKVVKENAVVRAHFVPDNNYGPEV